MDEKQQFDFWYAVNNTQVIRQPQRRLETFGNTLIRYHLVTELMDGVNQVRVREGQITAERPYILTPGHLDNHMLDGFGEDAGQYLDWLRHHQKDLVFIQYGFKISKQEINTHLVSDALDTVVERVKTELQAKDDPLSALLVGVDEPWEVCLLKLMVEVGRQSAPHNAREFIADPDGSRHEIEGLFLLAAKTRNKSILTDLAAALRRHKLFDHYQDRFFALTRQLG